MEIRRIRGVQMAQNGFGVREISRQLEVSPSSVSDWLKCFNKKGWKGLKITSNQGPPVQFKKKYRTALKKLLKKNPKDLGFGQDLWTVSMLRSELNEKFVTTFSDTTVLRYLHKEKMTYQRPKKVAYERSQEAEDEWLKEIFPKILADAKKRGARVFFEDESGFQMEAISGGTWAPIGKTPVLKRSGKRSKITAAAAISHLGDFHIKKYKKGGMTGERYAKFLESIKKSTTGRLWLSMMGYPLINQK